MKIWKYLQPEHVFLDVSLEDKAALFRFVADAFAREGVVKDPDLLRHAIEMREQSMSTGVGHGIGIPHAASPEAENATVILIRLAHPIDFEALDRRPVDIILTLVVPENQTALHLQILAGISRLCKSAEFLEVIRLAESPKKLLEGIKRLEEQMAFH